jgi:hypothetical protein
VVVVPAVNYSFFPTFVEYPGAASLRLEAARRYRIADICLVEGWHDSGRASSM